MLADPKYDLLISVCSIVTGIALFYVAGFSTISIPMSGAGYVGDYVAPITDPNFYIIKNLICVTINYTCYGMHIESRFFDSEFLTVILGAVGSFTTYAGISMLLQEFRGDQYESSGDQYEGKVIVQESSSELDFSSDTFCEESPKVITRDGLFYLPNQEEPYSGENICVYKSNGQCWSQGEIIKGLKKGNWKYWYENGQKRGEGSWKDGKQDDKWTWWHDNGQKESEENYKDGERDDKFTWWYENGQIKEENNYKDGKLDGKVTEWYENGQKWHEDYYKDDKLDGKVTEWDENGQKMGETNYKDGKRQLWMDVKYQFKSQMPFWR